MFWTYPRRYSPLKLQLELCFLYPVFFSTFTSVTDYRSLFLQLQQTPTQCFVQIYIDASNPNDPPILEGQPRNPPKPGRTSNPKQGGPIWVPGIEPESYTPSPADPADPDLSAPTLENFVPFAQDLVPFNHIELY